MTNNARNTPPSIKISPRVVEAERLGQGVFITFESGEFGFYSAILLYEMLARIEKFKGDFADGPGPSFVGL